MEDSAQLPSCHLELDNEFFDPVQAASRSTKALIFFPGLQ